MNEDLADWRRRIDAIDDQLMRLINSRSACAVEIGRIKRAAGLPVYAPEREAWILERVMRENPGPLDPLAVKRVFERIIDESRRLERVAAEAEEEEGRRLEQVERENPGPLESTAVRRVFERIIDESRRLERIAAEAEGDEGHRLEEAANKTLENPPE